MDKQYSILFWGKAPQNETFDDVVDSYTRLFEHMNTSSDIISDLMVKINGKYMLKRSSNLSNVVLSGVNKEHGNVFPNLGYRVSFKLSICKKTAYGSMLLGATDQRVTNTFRLQLPYGIDLNDYFVRNELLSLFKAISQDYNWFWGALIDSEISKKHKISYECNKPSSVYLMNYLEDSVICNIKNNITDDLKRQYGIIIDNNILLFDFSSFNVEGVGEINRFLL